MGFRQVGTLLLLSAVWGGSFLFMRVAAPVLGPVLLIELRVLLAGLALLVHGLLTKSLPDLRGYWRQYLVIGAINSAIPFVLVASAELHLPASLAATLNAMTPLFGVIVAALWTGERLRSRTVLGLAVGFAGVVVLVGLGPLPLSAVTLWSIGASLLAALFYGVAAVYTRARAQGAQPYALALYSQLFAALLLMPAVPFTLPTVWPSTTVIVSVLLLALLSTALAYRLYFYLIVSAGPTKATMVTYLSPAFGMLWGTVFLQEQLAPAFMLGFLLILGSVVLVSSGTKREVQSHGAVSVDGR